MRINTKLGLIAYIRSMLGAPLIDIEVTDAQMSQIIDDAVQMFTEYAYGDLESTISADIEGKGEYRLPENITNIIKVSRGNISNIANFSANYGQNFVPDLWSTQYFTNDVGGSIMPNVIALSNTTSILDKYFGDDIYYSFNPYKKVLQVFDNYKGRIIIHFKYEYIAGETDWIYNHEWIKKWTVAKTKFLWGSVVGKYSSNLVGGATINYSDMKSEAQSDLDALKEELIAKWSDPAPIDIA